MNHTLWLLLLIEPDTKVSLLLCIGLNDGGSSVSHWIIETTLLHLNKVHVHLIVFFIVLGLRLVGVEQLNVCALLLQVESVKFSLVQAHVCLLNESIGVQEIRLKINSLSTVKEGADSNQFIILHFLKL